MSANENALHRHYFNIHYKEKYPDNWIQVKDFLSRHSNYSTKKKIGRISFAKFKEVVEESYK